MHKRGDSMLVLHSLSGQIEPLTSVYDCVRKRSVDGEYSLSFLIDRTDRNAAQFDVLNNKSRIECDGELYVVDDCEREPDGESVTKQITANHDMYDRLKAQTVEQSYTAQKPLNEWLDIVLAGTGITYEIIGDFGSEQFDNFGMDQSINLFKQLRDRYVFEYRPIDTHLVIAVMIGTVTDAQFRHGHNLRTFSDDYDTNDLVTQVTMFGELDEEGNPTTSVTVQSPNINAFDRVYKLVKKDERYNNTGNLDDYAKTFLNDGKYSAKVEYEELKKNGLKLHNFTWGDFIWCIYDLKGIDVDLQPRIMSIEDYPEDQTRSPVVELGNFQSDITRSIANLSSAAQRVNQVIDPVTNTIIPEALGDGPTAAITKINNLTTDSGKLDLTKSDGRILADQASVGPGTSFAPGYDPTQIDIPEYSLATHTSDGLMSSADKTKLDGLDNQDIPIASNTQDGLMSKEKYQILSSIPSNGMSDGQGNTTYEVIVSDTEWGGLMSPEDVKKVHSLPKNEDGSVAEATEINDGLLGFNDKKSLNKLSPWIGFGSSGDIFDPKVQDPHNTGTDSLLSAVLANLESRLANFEGGG
jgi:phage minor structural protein